MIKRYPLYPAVDTSLNEVRDGMFRGNTFGQHGVYYQISLEDREVASQFDVAAAIAAAEKARQQLVA